MNVFVNDFGLLEIMSITYMNMSGQSLIIDSTDSDTI